MKMVEIPGWERQASTQAGSYTIDLYVPHGQTLETATEYLVVESAPAKRGWFGTELVVARIFGVVMFPGCPSEECQRALFDFQKTPSPRVYSYNGRRHGGVEGFLIVLEGTAPETIAHGIEALSAYGEANFGQAPMGGAMSRDSFLFDFLTNPERASQVAGYPLAKEVTPETLAKPAIMPIPARLLPVVREAPSEVVPSIDIKRITSPAQRKEVIGKVTAALATEGYIACGDDEIEQLRISLPKENRDLISTAVFTLHGTYYAVPIMVDTEENIHRGAPILITGRDPEKRDRLVVQFQGVEAFYSTILRMMVESGPKGAIGLFSALPSERVGVEAGGVIAGEGTKDKPYDVPFPDEIILGRKLDRLEQPDGSIKWVKRNDFVKYRTNVFAGGVKIVTPPGGGKSLLGKSLAYQFALNGVPVIIIDPKVGGEWAGLTSPVPTKYIHMSSGKEVSSARELSRYGWIYPKMGLDGKYFHSKKHNMTVRTEVAIFTIKSQAGVIWASHPLHYTITAERARGVPERVTAVVKEELVRQVAAVLSDYYKLRPSGVSAAAVEKAEEFKSRIATPLVEKVWKDWVKQEGELKYSIAMSFEVFNKYLNSTIRDKEVRKLVDMIDPQWAKVRKDYIMEELVRKEKDILSGISTAITPVDELIKSPIFDGRDGAVRISIITGRGITSEDIHLTAKNLIDKVYATMAGKKRTTEMGGDINLVVIFEETPRVAPGPVMKAEKAEPTSQSVIRAIIRLTNEARALKIVPILLAQRDQMIDKTVRDGRAINIGQAGRLKGRMSVINPVTEEEEYFEVPPLITDHTPVGNYEEMEPYIRASKTTSELKKKYNRP